MLGYFSDTNLMLRYFFDTSTNGVAEILQVVTQEVEVLM